MLGIAGEFYRRILGRAEFGSRVSQRLKDILHSLDLVGQAGGTRWALFLVRRRRYSAIYGRKSLRVESGENTAPQPSCSHSTVKAYPTQGAVRGSMGLGNSS